MFKIPSLFIRILIVSAMLLGFWPAASFAAANAQLQKAVDLTYNAQFNEAEKILNAHIVSHPSDPLGYMLRGTAKEWKRKVQNLGSKLDVQIIEDYKIATKYAFLQWNSDQNNVDKMINLGNSYMFIANKWINMGKKTRAGLELKKTQKHMQEAVQKDPSRFEAYLAMGIFNFYAGNLPSGLKFFASLLGISGNETLGMEQLKKAAANPNILQSDAKFVLSYAYGHTKKNYAAAKPYIDGLIAKYPANPYFRFLKGEYAMDAKQYDTARADLNAFLNYCSSKPEGHCAKRYRYLANHYIAMGYMNQNNPQPAEPYAERLEALDENEFPEITVRTHYYKAMVAKSKGNKKKAEASFKKVEELQAKNPHIWQVSKKEWESMK